MFKHGVLLVAAFGVFAAPPTSPTPNSAELTAPFTMEACGSCGWCIDGHKAPAGGSSSKSPDSWCMKLAHCNGHPGCNVTVGPSPEDALGQPLRKTIEDAIRGNPRALVALSRNSAVRWNESRGALQVEGTCDASVVAHIPVRRATAKELGLLAATRADD